MYTWVMRLSKSSLFLACIVRVRSARASWRSVFGHHCDVRVTHALCSKAVSPRGFSACEIINMSRDSDALVVGLTRPCRSFTSFYHSLPHVHLDSLPSQFMACARTGVERFLVQGGRNRRTGQVSLASYGKTSLML